MIRVDELSVTYPNGTRALRDVSLDITPGARVVLLGASGSGKSTLLRALNGLVRPSAGSATADGRPTALRSHRRRTGMVFQQHHLIGRLSVLENVLTGRLGYRGALASLLPWPRAHKLVALAALERVGLLERALDRADELSGGQQQRVGIARALAQGPRILLADEPVASLDPATATQILALLGDICRSDGLTVIVSLHQVALAREFGERIIGMREGLVVFDGPPAAFDAAAETRLYAPAGHRDPAPATPRAEFVFSKEPA